MVDVPENSPTRVVTALGAGSEAIPSVLGELTDGLGGESPVLVCVFAAIEHSLERVLSAASERWPGAVVIGCSSAGEFTEAAEAKQAITGFALAGDFQVRAGFSTGLTDNPERAVSEAAQALPAGVSGYPCRTAILLLDPLSGQGEEATLLAASILENDGPIRLVGGAAGDDLSMQQVSVGVGPQAASDALALAMIYSKRPFGIGVRHGHRTLSGALTVTKAAGNTVHEIDGQPAWDVWREHTREAAAARGIDVDNIDEQSIGGFLLTYEASLASGDEIKVRAPLVRGEDGSLSFATGIPQGAVIRITQSDATAQLDSAREAAELAGAQLEGQPAAGALVFDCICRNLILEKDFHGAVAAMSEALGGVPISGFETYGEIALDVGDMSGFHNTTSVVLAIPR